jgi:hypothetical protein
MTTIPVFIQLDGASGLTEAALPDHATGAQLYDALDRLGIGTEDATFVFVGDADEPITRGGKQPLALAPGALLHVTRCRKVKVTAHFLERSAEAHFAPGTRVKAVKAWAAGKFEMADADAAEHVLEICDSKARPATDSTLQQLTDGKRCSVCFNLVPDKRVEG